MIKEFLVVITPGIESYIQEGVMQRDVIEYMVKTAAKYAGESYFIAFHHNGGTTLITDGNDNVLGEIPLAIPEDMWFIFDETESQTICTGLLPKEY